MLEKIPGEDAIVLSVNHSFHLLRPFCCWEFFCLITNQIDMYLIVSLFGFSPGENISVPRSNLAHLPPDVGEYDGPAFDGRHLARGPPKKRVLARLLASARVSAFFG